MSTCHNVWDIRVQIRILMREIDLNRCESSCAHMIKTALVWKSITSRTSTRQVTCIADFIFHTNGKTSSRLRYLRPLPGGLSMGWELSRRIFAEGVVHRLSIILYSTSISWSCRDKFDATTLNAHQNAPEAKNSCALARLQYKLVKQSCS